MRIFTSYWSSPLLRDLDAQLIGISRGVPRWRTPYRYKVLRELAPSREAFAIEDRERFERVYTRQLEEIGAAQIIERLEAIADGMGAAILLCWERPTDEWCHRWQVASYLRAQMGLVVPELAPGDLPERLDVIQPTLWNQTDREEK